MSSSVGVVAYIVTLHPGILGSAALGSLGAAVGLRLLLSVCKVKRRARWVALFFVATLVVAHVTLSRLAGVEPLQLETVSLSPPPVDV